MTQVLEINRARSDPKRSPTLLDARELRRYFGETRALESCSLVVRAGEIHGLIGENGSGKSTLIKVLSGILAPDSGDIHLRGARHRLVNPRVAQQAGIATVFQETLVVDNLSVRDNVMLGLDRTIRRATGRSEELRLVCGVMRELGLRERDLHSPLFALPLAHRQLVTIARALVRPWRLLILDESTSSLDIQDRDRLFEILRRYRAEGRSILFVSHRIDEIASLADRATVLRSGRSVATLESSEVTRRRVLELMAPAIDAEKIVHRAPVDPVQTPAKLLLEMRGLSLRPGTSPFDLGVAAGEILGVAGLEGHGQDDLLTCAVGLKRPATGLVLTPSGAVRSFRSAVRHRVVFLPRDRKQEGVFLPLSIADNLALLAIRRLSSWGMLRRRKVRDTTDIFLHRLKIRHGAPADAIATLSGGNQQKVLFGRLLAMQPAVLVLNDPMRGIDLGAKHDLYELLKELAAGGMAILFLSTELAELCALCDRVAVFREHRLATVLDGAKLTEPALVSAMFGH